jgi:uncharacterized membrane protein YeaQ/YmgE (transglycosylase-associated protein family)
MIGFVVFGLVVGVIARVLKLGRQNLSLFVTLLVGMSGSVIGGTLANLIAARDMLDLSVVGSIVAVASAIGLLAAAEGIAVSRNSGYPSVGPRDTTDNARGMWAAKMADFQRHWGGGGH